MPCRSGPTTDVKAPPSMQVDASPIITTASTSTAHHATPSTPRPHTPRTQATLAKPPALQRRTNTVADVAALAHKILQHREDDYRAMLSLPGGGALTCEQVGRQFKSVALLLHPDKVNKEVMEACGGKDVCQSAYQRATTARTQLLQQCWTKRGSASVCGCTGSCWPFRGSERHREGTGCCPAWKLMDGAGSRCCTNPGTVQNLSKPHIFFCQSCVCSVPECTNQRREGPTCHAHWRQRGKYQIVGWQRAI